MRRREKEDKEWWISYQLWSRPERFLEEGEFEYNGETFRYKIKCPLCPMAFLNNDLERLLRDVRRHGFDHMLYFQNRNRYKKVVKVR
jgi:hypothetical protein